MSCMVQEGKSSVLFWQVTATMICGGVRLCHARSPLSISHSSTPNAYTSAAWTHPTLPQMTRMHGLRIGAVLAEVCSQGLEAEVQDCAMQFHGPAPQKLMNAVEPGIIWPRQMRTGHNCSLTDCSYGAKVAIVLKKPQVPSMRHKRACPLWPRPGGCDVYARHCKASPC